MAEGYDRQRRRRRRDRGDYVRHSQDVSPTPSKPPVTILGLAKPSPSRSVSSSNADDHPLSAGNITAPEGDPGEASNVHHTTDQPGEVTTDKSVTLLSSDNKTRPQLAKSNENETADNRLQAEDSSHVAEDNPAGLVRKVSAPSAVGSIISGVIDQGAQTQSKLAPPHERQTSVKLIDGNFLWSEAGLDLMLDQTDFLVVGVIGLQGCGKSTLLSLLAGNTHQDAYRNYIFFPQAKEAKEDCLYQTIGVDMFVTSERIILLDTQPLLSAAVMDCTLRYDRKIPSDFNSLQAFIEMQSMQLLTFLLSVCNIIIVADDWFIDINLLRILQDAEMLKPSTQPPSSSADNLSGKDDTMDFFPTVIFAHNKASRDDFTSESYFTMQQLLDKMFLSSKLKVHSGINMSNECSGEPIIRQMPGTEGNSANDINLLLIPTMEFYKSEPEWLETTMPEYRGYPSFNTILSLFRSQIVSAPRSPMTHSTLTEKNWYHFAARMWESVKKSALLSEYSRLLSSSYSS